MKRGPLQGALVALAFVAAGAALVPAALRAWVTGGSVVVLAVAAAGAFAHARALTGKDTSAFARLVQPAPPVERPADLRGLERTLGWGAYSPEDFRHGVAPVLARTLTSKLRARGVDAAAQPELARKMAGPALLVLLDPDVGPGAVVKTADIAHMVDAIEAL